MTTGCKTDLVGACTECHGEIEDFDFKQQDYDGNGIVEGVQTEVRGLSEPGGLHAAAGRSAQAGPLRRQPADLQRCWIHRQQLKAAYNYLFVVEDGSWGIHNMSYAVGLLKASIEDLSTDYNGDGIADWWQEAALRPGLGQQPGFRTQCESRG